jgi:hypothetical protein
MTHRNSMPRETINGWIVEKAPNSFAERHAWYAEAVDAEGYRIVRHGFSNRRQARLFSMTTDLPKLAAKEHDQ